MTQRVIAITGPNGFIAKSLRARLQADTTLDVRLVPRVAWDDERRLAERLDGCDAIFHIAGVNRGEDHAVRDGNEAMAKKLVAACDQNGSRPHIIFSSTTQRGNGTPYGDAKLAAERTLSDWSKRTDAPLSIAVLPNVYGAGCRPFYNSVVATFCHQLVNGEKPQVHQDREVEFIWVGDVVEQLHAMLSDPPCPTETLRLEGAATLRVAELLSKLQGYRQSFFQRHIVPDLSTHLEATLYSTFLSYVDLEDHRHTPEVKADDRGELYEIIKLATGGQVFFSTTKPGVIRGNHFHTRKVEWFCVLKGEAVIRLRPLHGDSVKQFRVSGDQPQFISIPVLHTHHIENVGDDELLTMFWCNEVFDQSDPDTYFERVA
ncbi:NAD dependent epimerase/dehydratase family protein [Posidoniimonas corsicana]|uniref:NAD dependent epimerase/dehydratase family protein n=1 Tax=Posidoniimonas corsicana TaxID=1938618 RepID=A0A5C5V7Q3_9BACT|nr:NAD-dependent epimerase/dehydratase family protein [Posidoniimonas corsicana]TWT34013.1 NAD dependent epimerase/dehydratase family protein [Posidoniimonas corsicana]